MLQHVCSQLDWAHLNLEWAGTSQRSRCRMEVTLQPLPGVHRVGAHTGPRVLVRCLSQVFPCMGVPSVWVWATAVSLQGHPFCLEAVKGQWRWRGDRKVSALSAGPVAPVGTWAVLQLNQLCCQAGTVPCLLPHWKGSRASWAWAFWAGKKNNNKKENILKL